MAVLLKKRVFNPGKKRLTARQKLFFGSKRQRTAAKRSLSNKGKRRNTGRRVKNVGEIITLSLPKRKVKLNNPMATRRRRNSRRRRNAPRTWSALYRAKYYRTAKAKKRSNGRRSKLANPRRRRRRNSSRVITRYRYRNPGRLVSRRRNSSRRRRNPGFLGADITKVAGILGGATVTNLIVKQLPATYSTGTLGYATLTATALAQGYLVKKVFKNAALGEDMMIGGLVLVAIKLMGDLFPTFSLGLSGGRGLGLIGNSSFTVPQIPVPGSMGKFQIAPNYQSAINAAIPPMPAKTMNGINTAVTMGGRTGARRVGRIN
jgi:hypothetical protein